MPKATLIQSNFNAGEVSPLIYGRVESPRYKQGLASCQNYIPTLQGPLQRKPGNMFMNAIKDSTKPGVLIPFQFSVTQAYMLEFGDAYIRFYANNGQVVVPAATTCYKITGNISTIGAPSQVFTGIRPSVTAQLGETGVPTSVGSISAGSTLELVSPYGYGDLPKLKWTQSADTLYLFHPSYPVYKLQRFAQYSWRIVQAPFQDGPYFALNTLNTLIGDSANVALTVTSVSAGVAAVETATSCAATVTGAVTDPGGSGQIQITCSGGHTFVTGQNVYVTSIAGTVEANNKLASSGTGPYYWPIVVTSTTTFLLVGSTFVNGYSSGGTVVPGLWGPDIRTLNINTGRQIAIIASGVRYWGVIASFTHAGKVVVNIGTSSTLWVTGDATGWYLGTFSYVNGFPAAGCFHQNRLALVGVPNFPQEMDLSCSPIAGAANQFEIFSPSPAATLTVNDSSAIQYPLNSSDSNVLQWVVSTAQGLLTGSYVSEWCITPDSVSAALTPSNFNAQQTSFYGSANAQAVQLGNSALYIQRAGRKVREMNFFFQSGTFRSTDMTEISEHITLPTITQIAVQKETQPLIWAIRSDGILVSMIFNRDDTSLVAGWSRHVLGGQSDSSGTPPQVISIAVIPAPDLTFDQLWMIVKRWINGATVYTIEYMTRIFDDSVLQEDAVLGDCGATYYNPKTITAMTLASPAVITSASHGFSNGDFVKIVGMVGLNKSSTDVNGNVTTANLVNEKTFVVASVATNTFALHDFNGANVSSVGYSAYISGGKVSKLVTSITGLTWLENETVSILADGSVHPDVVVSNSGGITLSFPAAKVQIGYRTTSQGQLLRAEAGAADGSSIGKTRRTCRAAFQLHNAGDLSMGTSFTSLLPVQLAQADQNQADNAVPLFSGIIRDGVESAYDFESQLCFQQNSMLPGMIQSITSFMEEFDI
jgi:hypothetical protein